MITILILSHGRQDLLRKCLDSLPAASEEVEIKLIKPDEAVGELRGEWLLFTHEDCYFGPAYWEMATELLKNPGADVFGGPVLMGPGTGPLGRSLGMALSSPLCAGTTFPRHRRLGAKLITADEEKLNLANLWARKRCLEQFPSISILQALKAQGAGLFYHPNLVAYQIFKWRPEDFFRKGFERSRTMRLKISPGQEMFWLPALFVILHGLIFLDPSFFWQLVRLYGGMAIFVSLGLSMRVGRPWLFPIVAVMHYLVVLFYGVGFLVERIKRQNSYP